VGGEASGKGVADRAIVDKAAAEVFGPRTKTRSTAGTRLGRRTWMALSGLAAAVLIGVVATIVIGLQRAPAAATAKLPSAAPAAPATSGAASAATRAVATSASAAS